MPNATKPATEPNENHTNSNVATDVYAVHGADPEVQAYGMAKYSRSALSLRESLAELNEQKAEKFLNTFYFQYGHRSIADLAHIAFAIEKLSILAATIVVDEPRWDGQERSTRYQDFQKSGYYCPTSAAIRLHALSIARPSIFCSRSIGISQRTCSDIWRAHSQARGDEAGRVRAHAARPAPSISRATCCRWRLTRRWVRSSTHARWRTRYRACCRTPHEEVRQLGELLKKAARESGIQREPGGAPSPWWTRFAASRPNSPNGYSNSSAGRPRRSYADEVCRAQCLRDGEPARTAAAAAELLGALPIEPAPLVDLLDDEPLEIELATTLLYQYSITPIGRFARRLKAWPAAPRAKSSTSACAIAAVTTSGSRLSRRPAIPLRHPHGHRRLSRHAPPSALRADHAGFHDRPRLRHGRPKSRTPEFARATIAR